MALLAAKEHLEEPTDWLSAIFVVPKPNEDIRICVNFRKLIQAIKWGAGPNVNHGKHAGI